RMPFNPLLGETFQGHWPDGTRVFLEQTAIDPPSTAFLVRSAKSRFSFWGNFAFRAQLKVGPTTASIEA
ncbi:phosphatidylinositol transfer protein, partial [Toxoplasma gondii MAS]